MNQENVLSQLKDIDLPAAVSIFPLATGWWIVLFSLAVATVIFILWKVGFLANLQFKREAYKQLQKIETEFSAQKNTPSALNEISILLKKICLKKYPTVEVASLTGEAWLRFLDQTNKTHDFTHGIGKALNFDRFKKQSQANIPELITLVKKWIKKQ